MRASAVASRPETANQKSPIIKSGVSGKLPAGVPATAQTRADSSVVNTTESTAPPSPFP